MKTVVDKASSRGYFNHGWLKTHHTFSFANYYNPSRMHFGVLRVLNDDSVDPEMGFDTHPHQNMEVISIPLKGYLRHGDSVKNTRTITPGDIQVMSTGKGIFSSTVNIMEVTKSNWNFCKYGYSRELKIQSRNITTTIFVLY